MLEASPRQATGIRAWSSYRNAPRAAPTSLRLASTTSRESLLAGVGDAVHLQQLAGAGTGLSAVTGRVDVGCAWWQISDGIPAGRIPTTPLAGSLPAVLRAILKIADDVRQVPSTPVLALRWNPARVAALAALHRQLDAAAAQGLDLGCVYVSAPELLNLQTLHETWTHGSMIQRILSG